MDINEIISKATYISNILYANNILSSLEVICFYTPAIQGRPKSPASEHFQQTHEDQSVRQALLTLYKRRSFVALKPEQLSVGKICTFQARETNFAPGNVQQLEQQSLI